MRGAVGRGAGWLLRVALVATVAVAVAPVTVVAAATAGYAWWRGWTPRRLYQAAAWCLPMAATWLIAVAVWPERAATLVTAPGFRLPPPGVGPGATWLRGAGGKCRGGAQQWPAAPPPSSADQEHSRHGQVGLRSAHAGRCRWSCRVGSFQPYLVLIA